mgnify:CR=1 FL=1
MLETPQSKIMIPELDLAYQCNDQVDGNTL